MKSIYKYKLDAQDENILKLRGPVLSAGVQGGDIMVWAVHDDELTPRPVRISIRGTGHLLEGADGDVIGAKQRLSDAISRLIDPKPETRHLEDGHIRIEWLDSLYTQLVEAVPGERRHQVGTWASTPPMWVDASDLRHLIDRTVTGWEPHWPIPLPTMWEWAYKDDYPTVQRLQLLERRRWRPQDCHLIDSYTNSILGWCDKIRDLLTDAPKCTLPNPCPACGVGVVYREYAGEQVRRPALQISAEGCTCQHCRYNWSPQLFHHLAAVLGYPLPAGVLQ